eukprot:NODE_695_length_5088_cov_0.763480.p2 type:complete len:261 gc:universal NODE_695_length_5088_cov_0.763480:523-1305(+)
MARGPKKHLKRLAAPKHWMLDKLTGTWAPKPSPGPHKTRECLPLVLFLRNRLRYALTGKEVTSIVMQRLIQVDGKVRTDTTYPTGFMDVVSIPKTNEHFRLIYDVKGRFAVHRISDDEAKYKLLKVTNKMLTSGKIPALVTHDGRTIRFPDPAIKVHDTIKYNLTTRKVEAHIKYDLGNVCMIIGGRNIGRVGIMINKEKHIGGHDIIHVKDVSGNSFATRSSNVFVIGQGTKPWVSLPKEKGIKLTITEERDRKRKQQA